MNSIQIKGAYENNLKHISVSIPKNKLVVLTGPSGSGKSTLAMDTLQRECQRQYMESLGMTTDSVSKSKVEAMVGLSPSISIGQQITNRNPRSTVGTVTDMFTYLRLIYERLGEHKCPNCQYTILPSLDKETMQEETSGYTQYIHCPHCNTRLEKFTRSHFSFNTPEGACPTCDGLGEVSDIKKDMVIDENVSLNDGCVKVWMSGTYFDYQKHNVLTAAEYYQIPIDEKQLLNDYSVAQRDLLFYGVESQQFKAHFPNVKPPKTVSKGKFEGVLTSIWRRYKEKGGQSSEASLFFSQTCPDCHGKRLNKESRDVLVHNTSITELTTISLEDIYYWLQNLQTSLTEGQKIFVETYLHDLLEKISRVLKVGLGYLNLDRQTITLSGGEAQRLRLASLLGSGLTGVLYILDEPTAGLHPKDTKGLVDIMKQLRDLGNTVLVIEHDVDVMKEADHIIDMGPEAGSGGGEIVGEGTVQELQSQTESVTGAFLRENRNTIFKRRKGTGQAIQIQNAFKHNLKNISIDIPLNRLVSVSGVSGSGKSTLIFDVLANQDTTECESITGLEAINDVITASQAGLSRMQRSNVSTYTDMFTTVRNLFANLPEAKEQGFRAKNFSFNTAGGRCENCQGLGFISLNMHFIYDLEVVCPVCHGTRFKEELLTVKYEGYSVSDILNMSIAETMELFENHKALAPKIQLLNEIGLGYLKWGQSLTTLSGGEGQRLKLAKELNKKTNNHTLYILDEPSNGLHPKDVKQLLVLLNKLVESGNTVIVVEHNIDIIRASDWVIDLGPEGGNDGGAVVATGTPEEVVHSKTSYTAKFLKESLRV
ncbi:excinuclease ABC subunit A [Gracilibacillus orientalis]|uniref:UvrABC system protein A n=1 Tax=Gracilibacillus orientalis TaxID=334253 RepID=A0A1I4IVA8_9BACI|nr:excinuclease ABC subunit UvrA [Gracilibacillus orientalis]SFL58309.1 excinuclease ABC subunit A [Gracilibacillus orientalis]